MALFVVTRHPLLQSEYRATGQEKNCRTAEVIRLGSKWVSRMQAMSFGPDPRGRQDGCGPGSLDSAASLRRVRTLSGARAGGGLVDRKGMD